MADTRADRRTARRAEAGLAPDTDSDVKVPSKLERAHRPKGQGRAAYDAATSDPADAVTLAAKVTSEVMAEEARVRFEYDASFRKLETILSEKPPHGKREVTAYRKRLEQAQTLHALHRERVMDMRRLFTSRLAAASAMAKAGKTASDAELDTRVERLEVAGVESAMLSMLAEASSAPPLA